MSDLRRMGMDGKGLISRVTKPRVYGYWKPGGYFWATIWRDGPMENFAPFHTWREAIEHALLVAEFARRK